MPSMAHLRAAHLALDALADLVHHAQQRHARPLEVLEDVLRVHAVRARAVLRRRAGRAREADDRAVRHLAHVAEAARRRARRARHAFELAAAVEQREDEARLRRYNGHTTVI